MPEEDNISRQGVKLIGGDPDNLGCVMLDVALRSDPSVYLNPKWAYHSPNNSYVTGYDVKPHVTLLYGLVFSAKEHQDLIDAALKTWMRPSVVLLDELSVFHATDGDQDYAAIVAKPDVFDTAHLSRANASLSRLPHTRGFVDYDPHVTIGYVKGEFAEVALASLGQWSMPTLAMVRGLNYGD